MKMLKISLLVLLCPLSAFCQEITGLWTGTIYNDSTQQYHQYEIGISKENGRYTGYSHTWFVIDNKKYFGVKKLKVRVAASGKIIIEDGELLLNNYPVQPNKNVRQLNVLDMEQKGQDLVLKGPFETNRTKDFLPLTGTVVLTKKPGFSQSDLVPHLQNIAGGEALSFVGGTAGSLVKNEKK